MILRKVTSGNRCISRRAKFLAALECSWKDAQPLKIKLANDLNALENIPMDAETREKIKMIQEQIRTNRRKIRKRQVSCIRTEQIIATKVLENRNSTLSSPQIAALGECIHGRAYAGTWFGSPPLYFLTFLQEYRELVTGESPVLPGDRIVFDHDLSPAPIRIERTVKSGWTFIVKEIPVPEGFRFDLSDLIGPSQREDQRDMAQ